MDMQLFHRRSGFTVLLIVTLLLTSLTSVTQAQTSLGECAYADIAFVVDSSESITAEFWNELKDFLVQFVDRLEIGSMAVQVGVIQFSSNAQIPNFNLNSYRNKTSLQIALRGLQNIGSQTNTAEALDLLVNEMFVRGNGDRFDAPNIAIVLTDGQANVRKAEVESSARAVKARGKDCGHGRGREGGISWGEGSGE